MKKRIRTGISLPVMGAVILCFLLGLSRVEADRQTQAKAALEDALRRTAVSCYALEGIYPPDVAYMQTHYGLQYDESRFTVHYEVYASNLMPDITVLDKGL